MERSRNPLLDTIKVARFLPPSQRRVQPFIRLTRDQLEDMVNQGDQDAARILSGEWTIYHGVRIDVMDVRPTIRPFQGDENG